MPNVMPPAEYKWRSDQRRKVWLTPTAGVPCSNAAKTRNPLKLAGVPQTTGPISTASRRSSPYCEDSWRRLLLHKFFPIVDMCISC